MFDENTIMCIDWLRVKTILKDLGTIVLLKIIYTYYLFQSIISENVH